MLFNCTADKYRRDLIFFHFVSAALCLFATSAFPFFATDNGLFAIGWIIVCRNFLGDRERLLFAPRLRENQTAACGASFSWAERINSSVSAQSIHPSVIETPYLRAFGSANF